MIPKKIFQTYKVTFDELSDSAKKLIQGWKENNPDYEYHYYSDKDIEDFIIEHYDEAWYQRYLSLEYPVMKADVFRILVVYVYGGFYTDLDMESKKPIDLINKKNTLACVGAHSNGLFFHPFFGFAAKHPMMKYLVESLAKSIDNNNLKDFNNSEHMVHQKYYKPYMHNRDNLIVRYVMDVCGPLWWSEEILKFLELHTVEDILEVYRGEVSNQAKEIMKKNGIEIFLDDPNTTVYLNLLGSLNNFYGKSYESWYGAY
jgi:hypothetical protein